MFKNIIIYRQSIFLHPCKELRNLPQHKSVLSAKTFKNFEEAQLWARRPFIRPWKADVCGGGGAAHRLWNESIIAKEHILLKPSGCCIKLCPTAQQAY